VILDTSAVIERVRARKPITEDITAVTLVEYPKIIYYRHFSGGVVFPVYEDYIVAHRLQLALIGKPQAFSDLLVAAVAINRGEELATRDGDFEVIGEAARAFGLLLKVATT
jgi:predicted nucleic acid-binding protein